MAKSPGMNGLAGRLDDRGGVAATLLAPGPEGGRRDKVPFALAPSLRARGNASHREDTEAYALGRSGMSDDPLLPLGLDSHRYRCCGNGVVADVSYWIGARLLASLQESVA